jgi:peptidyl-prolyl cis-trans isomerase A (cyclophilin A)
VIPKCTGQIIFKHFTGKVLKEIIMSRILLLCGILCFFSILLYSQKQTEVTAPDTFRVEFTTTKGSFIVEAYRKWSPKGVDRFYNLVKINFYEGLPIFRVVKNFVAQFGISNEYETNKYWEERPIEDEPCLKNNLKGYVAFARSGVNTRTTQIFINLQDNTRLDTVTYNGVKGFPPIGRIIEGIDVIDHLNSEYGDAPNQDSITVKGREYTQRKFPQMDYINKISIVD